MNKDAPSLPASYTCIIPTSNCKPEPPTTEEFARAELQLKENLQDSKFQEWLQRMETFSITDAIEDRASFSAFFSQMNSQQTFNTSSTLLPLIYESINSPAMVRHCMNLIKVLTNNLNPSQVSVITGDQPVYALGKQVQWMFPDAYRNVFSFTRMMGQVQLHIEMAFMNAIGDWLEGSGWVEIFEKARITTPGRIESFLTGRKVKRTRYAHQLSLAALTKLSKQAFEDQNEYTDFDHWKEKAEEKSANSVFWFRVIELESILFEFIKSLRQADFPSFVSSLKKIMPWMFSLDHVHYSRWMSVFLKDLTELPAKHEEIFQQFVKGFFTVKKSGREFSCIGIDQAHEQNNKLIKIDGGAIGIFDNPGALLRWAVAGPMIGNILTKSEDRDAENVHHHEDTDAYEKTFRSESEAVYLAFLEYGNPFKEEEKGLLHIVSKHLLNEDASSSVREAKQQGKNQYQKFVDERLTKGDISFYDNIKKNNLALFRRKNSIVTSKAKKKMMSLNSDRRLYASLYIACQQREGDLDSFFSHENHSYPIAISEYGKLRKCSAKSDFLKCLDNLVEVYYESPNVDVKIVDGAAFVNMNPPRSSNTFGEYCDNELRQKIIAMSRNLCRLDLVFDTYLHDSLKAQTRESRGTGVRISVRKDTPITKHFHSFMRCDENKTELFQMIAESAVSIAAPPVVVATKLTDIKVNTTIDSSLIQPCNHEEADTRVLLHVCDASARGYKKIAITTVDTCCHNCFVSLFLVDIDELWIEFGVGKHRKYLPIHEYANALKEEICRALPFWFTLTGCDSVSMFAGRGKTTAWKVWEVHAEVTETFVR